MKEKNTDVKTAKSLYAEYKRHLKYATREDAPQIEKDYFLKMANITKARINFSLLEQKKKVVEEDKYDEYAKYRA